MTDRMSGPLHPCAISSLTHAPPGKPRPLAVSCFPWRKFVRDESEGSNAANEFALKVDYSATAETVSWLLNARKVPPRLFNKWMLMDLARNLDRYTQTLARHGTEAAP